MVVNTVESFDLDGKRGMRENEVRIIGTWMVEALRAPDDSELHTRIARLVRDLCAAFPVPGID